MKVGDLVCDYSIGQRGLIVESLMDGDNVHEFVILYEEGFFSYAFPFEVEVINDNT